MISLGTLATIVILLGVAALFARLAAEAGLPPAGAIMLVGISAGGILPHALTIELRPGVLAVFLPALIFEAAWDIDARVLRRVAGAIAVLALPGTLLTAMAIAAAATVGGLQAGPAFVLGAILSATDPVAVLALFRRLRIPPELFTIVEGESIANDGVAAVLVIALVPLAATWWSTAGAGAVFLRMLMMSIGGIAAGVGVALAATPVLRATRFSFLRIVVTLGVAYGAYALAAFFGASGILASAAAGVALPAIALGDGARDVERFWDRVAIAANALVFLLTGLSLRLERIFHEPLLLAAIVLAVVASRAFLAFVLVPLKVPAAARAGWRGAIALAGVRGGLSLALALGLPADFPGRASILDAVFAVVFLTVVVQGWILEPVLRRLILEERPRAA
jgi:CPA1 family monovalent cation:H+ antiporter